ncbi:MAG: hypothetical protein LLG16_03420 [Euryarchaeota archaeon]|nr:hypothetical protein [Euryarchaeota archaeon]
MSKNLVLFACLIVAFLTLTPSGALADTARWTEPVVLDDGLSDSSMPSVAMNARGDAIVAWVQYDGASVEVFVRLFSEGAWGPATMLDQVEGDSSQIQVALNDDGVGMAVWRLVTGIDTARICASSYHDGAWGSPVAIDNGLGYASSPQLATDEDGNAFVVWGQDKGANPNIYVNRYSSGAWGSAVLLDNQDGIANDAHVATNGGDAVVVWTQYDGSYWSAYASRFSGSWTLPTPLETADGDAYSPRIAMGDDGTAIAVWDQIYVSGYHMFANRFSSGTWGGRTLIEDMEMGAVRPQIAMSGSEATVVWMQDDASSVPNIYAVRFVSGTWGGATLLDSSSDHAIRPRIAMSGEGEATVVWTQGFNITACQMKNGTWGAPAVMRVMESMLLPGYFGSNNEPLNVAVNRYGDAIAVWMESSDSKSPFSVLASFCASDVSLTIDSPMQGSMIDGSTVLVTGSTNPRADLKVNGYDVDVADDGSFSILIPLESGDNVITATATDSVWGSSDTTSFTVTYDEGDTSDTGTDYDTIGLVLSCVALVIALIAILLVLKKK